MNEPLRVLLVEDDEMDAELVRVELERAGFELRWLRVDTEPALRGALEGDAWDLIISDFSMPQFNGLDAFEVFRHTGKDTPFIFVSGALGEERAVEAMRAGARDYFLKGNLARLGVAVRRELAEARLRGERLEANERADRERQRLGIAVAATGAGIYEHDRVADQGTILSDRWLELLGYSRAEFERSPSFAAWLADHIHPEDRDFVSNSYREFLEGRTLRCALEMRMRHGRGHWLPVALFAMASRRDAGGVAQHVVGVLLDLSSQRTLEVQLRQAQKMEAIGRLASGVAHDFNNLLTAIFSFGNFVLEATEGQGEVHEDMLEVLHAARKAEALTSQLLSFSRARPVAPKIVDIDGLVLDMERMLRRLLGAQVDLRIELPPEPWNVRVDVGSFEQVLLNLVVNARDAMPSGGKLDVCVRNVDHAGETWSAQEQPMPPGQYVLLQVSDQGEGMSEETQRRIFEPFFTTKALGKGTGLGLATVYGIVQQTGGYIRLESTLGAGTTFRLYFPRSMASAALDLPTLLPTRLIGHENIIVVEDDEQVRALAVRTLSKHGYDVADVDEPLALTDEELSAVDLLLIDVRCCERDGRSVVSELKARHAALKVLHMSGHADAAISQRGVLDSGIALLRKPFDAKDLLLEVRATLDRQGG